MTSFQDAPDENFEYDKKMKLRSSLVCFGIVLKTYL